MAKRFTGDNTHQLIFPLREAYRLWFSFLRMALQDSRITVDKKFYSAWGDISGVKFDDWWKNNWRLFATESGMQRLSSNADWKTTASDGNKIVVAIPRDQPLAQTKRQLAEILKMEGAHKRARL